jgi:hypothetical protein
VELRELQNKLKDVPGRRLYAYGALIIFGLIYLAWSFFHKPAPTAQVFTQAPPAVKTPKVDGPTVKVRIVPKAAVKKKYPEYHGADAPMVEVIDTADVPPMPNGATTVTAIDTVTGEATTSVEPKKSPWLAFEDQDYIGAGMEAGTNGARAVAYYKRDIIRVKDIHLQVKPVEIKVPISGNGDAELSAGAYIEWRF